MNYQFGNSFVYNFIFLGGMSIRTLTRVAGVTGTTEARTRGAACELELGEPLVRRRLAMRDCTAEKNLKMKGSPLVPMFHHCVIYLYMFLFQILDNLLLFLFFCFLFVGICFLHRL